MYNNFIFDFGQVIVRFDTEYMTSVYVKNPEEIKQVEEVVFDRLYWDKLDAGTITDEEVKAGIRSRLPEHLQESGCAVYDNWYRNLPFADGMLELIRKIKENGGRLFLISNISKGFAENYATVPELKELFDLFDGVVCSGPIGITKPNKEIFDYVLNKYNLKAEESIFFDDNKGNVLGAEKAGIKGYLFSFDSVADIYNLIG